MACPVDDLGEQEGDEHDDGPLDAVHPVGLFVADATCRLIDMRLEEAQDRGYEVPSEVDDSQETSGLDSGFVGEQHLESVP